MSTLTAKYKGEDKKFQVIRPRLAETREAQKVYNTTFKDALDSGAILRVRLETIMRQQKVWNDELELKFKTIKKDIRDLEFRLKSKGITLSQARTIAIKIVDLRNELSELLSIRNEMDAMTAESQADNARFNYLVSACIVDEAGNRVFASLDEYIENAGEEIAHKGAEHLASLMSGYNFSEEDNIEYAFLKKYKFVDEKLRLIDKKGRLINRDGDLVNEAGLRINEDGKLIDINGRVIDENGDHVVGESYFLDDDGNPIVEDEVKEEPKAEEVKEVISSE